MSHKVKPVWLEGYYPPDMDDFAMWSAQWTMGPHAEPDWVWFKGDHYTESGRKTCAAEEAMGHARR